MVPGLKIAADCTIASWILDVLWQFMQGTLVASLCVVAAKLLLNTQDWRAERISGVALQFHLACLLRQLYEHSRPA